MEDLQIIYEKILNEFVELEQDVLTLEKKYFSIEPIFDSLNLRVKNILSILPTSKAIPFKKRIAQFKAIIEYLKNEKGYEAKIFSQLNKQLKKMIELAPREIVEPRLLRHLKNSLLKELESEQAISRIPKDSDKYLMLKNGRMHFLFPYSKKVWQKVMPYCQDLSLKVKSKKKNLDTVVFKDLPGRIQNDKANSKVAILLKNERVYTGILTDHYEGTMYLKPSILRKQTIYLRVRDRKLKGYLRIKGQRYYLIDDSTL